MCQLLGMNCNTPTDVTFSFTGFAQRGGNTDHHTDGWGIAFFEGRGLRHFVDHLSACESPVAELIRRYPIKSHNVVAHIRKATQGVVNLQNCHPFVRELWGRYWVFAHNGDLKDFSPRAARQLQAGGHHRQRARLLLDHAGAGQVARRRAQRGRAHPHAARAGAADCAARHLQLHAVQRRGAVGPCVHAAALRGAAPPVQPGHAERRRPVGQLCRTHGADRPRGGGGDHAADHQRAWTAFAPGELKVFVDGALQAA